MDCHDCSCHISPPCQACVDCLVCGLCPEHEIKNCAECNDREDQS